MNDSTTHGHCLCASIRFRVAGDPIWIGHCHCESCRRNTGSAVATFVAFRPGQVTYTHGERTFFTSSPGVRHRRSPPRVDRSCDGASGCG